MIESEEYIIVGIQWNHRKVNQYPNNILLGKYILTIYWKDIVNQVTTKLTDIYFLFISLLFFFYKLCINFHAISNVHIFMGWIRCVMIISLREIVEVIPSWWSYPLEKLEKSLSNTPSILIKLSQLLGTKIKKLYWKIGKKNKVG